jgi:MraZ protein
VKLYAGEFDITLDARRRMVIPRQVARMLGEFDRTLVVTRGRDGRPWLYTAGQFGTMMLANLARRDTLPVMRTHHLDWSRRHRRFTMRAKLIHEYHLDRRLTLVGVRDHLELWNREEWERYSERLMTRAREIAERAARPPSPPKSSERS